VIPSRRRGPIGSGSMRVGDSRDEDAPGDQPQFMRLLFSLALVLSALGLSACGADRSTRADQRTRAREPVGVPRYGVEATKTTIRLKVVPSICTP
jgi:hypothetical protein